MRDKKAPGLTVETFPDYQVITQPNPLRSAVRRIDERNADDPIARAEQALDDLSGEFGNWMHEECDRMARAYAAIVKGGNDDQARDELFRAAHDIKGDAATFGFPTAAVAAESLCRIIEHSPDFRKVPHDLIAHHVNAIQAIVRENAKINASGMASELSKRLRKIADEYLIGINKDRPEHLEAVIGPPLAPHG